jgi:hypothetical protein
MVSVVGERLLEWFQVSVTMVTITVEDLGVTKAV